MIDIDAVTTEVITVAREGVGAQLSTIASGTLPAVIKAFGNAPEPSYPYITVYYLGMQDEDGWLNDERINATDTLEYYVNKLMGFTYTVYGKTANKIAHELCERFVFQTVRDNLRSNVGAGVVQLTNVKDLPTKLGDKNYIEASEFSLTLSIKDTISDTSTGYIDNINLYGELYQGKEDPSPLPMTIVVP